MAPRCLGFLWYHVFKYTRNSSNCLNKQTTRRAAEWKRYWRLQARWRIGDCFPRVSWSVWLKTFSNNSEWQISIKGKTPQNQWRNLLQNARAWNSSNNEFPLRKHCLLVMRDPDYRACAVFSKGLTAQENNTEKLSYYKCCPCTIRASDFNLSLVLRFPAEPAHILQKLDLFWIHFLHSVSSNWCE